MVLDVSSGEKFAINIKPLGSVIIGSARSLVGWQSGNVNENFYCGAVFGYPLNCGLATETWTIEKLVEEATKSTN
jgi:hypothetical protein